VWPRRLRRIFKPNCPQPLTRIIPLGADDKFCVATSSILATLYVNILGMRLNPKQSATRNSEIRIASPVQKTDFAAVFRSPRFLPLSLHQKSAITFAVEYRGLFQHRLS